MEDEKTNSDEVRVEENATDLSNSEPMPENTVVPPTKPKKSPKPLILFLALLALAAVVAYLLFTNSTDDTNDSSTTTEQTNQSEETSQIVDAPDELDQIIYAHTDDDSTPKVAYSRPADGGDRTELGFNIASTSFLSSGNTTDGDQYIYIDGNTLFYGEGTGLPVSVYEIPTGNQFVSAAIDGGSNTIVVSYASTPGVAQQLKKVVSINTDGTNETTLFEQTGGELGGVYITDWNGDSGQLLGKISCISCDGFNADVYRFDENGEGEKIVDGGEFSNEVSSVVANSDSTKLLYIKGTTYTDAEIVELNIQSGLGQPSGPPYELHQVDIESGEDTVLATFGEKQDIEGKFQVPAVASWSTVESGELPTYSYQNQLFTQNNSGAFSLFFETGQGDIYSIIAVTDNEVLVASRTNDGGGDGIVSYFNLEEEKAETVMQTTFNTLILGYTLK